MNRLIINGVTIEFPEDSLLTVNGGTVSIKHAAGKEVKAVPQRVEYINDIPKPSYDKPPTYKELPRDIDKIIIRFLRERQGKQYAIGISKMVAKLLRRKLDWKTKHALQAKLIEMVDVGVLVILAQTPHTLYGLAAMQQLSVADDQPIAEPPMEYVNG